MIGSVVEGPPRSRPAAALRVRTSIVLTSRGGGSTGRSGLDLVVGIGGRSTGQSLVVATTPKSIWMVAVVAAAVRSCRRIVVLVVARRSTHLKQKFVHCPLV